MYNKVDESFGGSIGEVTVHDPLNVLDGPITRSRAKKIKEAMVRFGVIHLGRIWTPS